MRRKGSFSGLFPSGRENALSPAAARLSMSMSLLLSAAQNPHESESSGAMETSAAEAEAEASALDRAVAAVLSTSGSSSHIAITQRPSLQALDSDQMQGFMVIHTKKSKRKKLFTLNRSYFVVAGAERPVVEVFTNDTRTERVYLFSLAGAHVDFETDDVSHAVRAKCFCLNVQSWRKRGVDYLRPQGFVFYQEDQAQMMYWVKCIHVAIRRANESTSKLVLTDELRLAQRCRHSDASTVGADESDAAESERVAEGDSDHDDSERGSFVGVLSPPRSTFTKSLANTVTSTSPTSNATVPAPRSPRRHRGLNRRREAADPIAGSMATTTSTVSPSTHAKPPHFPLLNTMLAKTIKHGSSHQPHQHNPHSFEEDKAEILQPTAATHAASPSSSSNRPSLMSSLHMPRGKSTSSRHVVGVPSSATGGKRLSDPFQFRKKDDALFSHFPPFFSPRGTRNNPPQTATTAHNFSSNRQTSTADTSTVTPLGHAKAPPSLPPPPSAHAQGWRLSSHLARLAFLLVVCLGGILQLSVLLPFAAAGVFVYVSEPHADSFASAVVAACWVYAASCVQASLGLGAIAAIGYGWSYADFRTALWRRRRRIAERLLDDENLNFAHVQFPAWAVRPDVDRVVWLNKVLTTGWPFMKVAIRNSILDNLNPVLESSRPAFMSSLSLVRVDFGSSVPVISGVKFISADAHTHHVTLDVDVRLMSDESLVAELRMVSSLGAAAVVTLRDLLLAGTLRVTLSPLATYWPCFGAISLCFTERPLVDFSLTAAKINLSNVPFASEWLQTFLHDLLLDYFVWPKVYHIPLWDETGATSTAPTPTP